MINPARTPALGVRFARSVIDTGRGTRRVQRAEREATAGTPGAPRAPRGIFDPALLRAALRPALRKFDPRQLYRNPVMFVVEVTAALVTLVFLADLTGVTTPTAGEVGRSAGFELQIAVWLWFTVYFATYAEALAEARARGLATIAMVGYDGGAIAAEGLADHVILTRSQHVPRIQEAQASAWHALRELLEDAP